MAIRALFRQLEVGKIAGVIDHRDAFLANFGDKSGSLTNLLDEITTMALEISAFFSVQVVKIQNRIVNQDSHEASTNPPFARLFGRRRRLVQDEASFSFGRARNLIRRF